MTSDIKLHKQKAVRIRFGHLMQKSGVNLAIRSKIIENTNEKLKPPVSSSNFVKKFCNNISMPALALSQRAVAASSSGCK